MTKKIYVGNLSEDTTKEDLLDNFGDLGKCISVNIIKDKSTGKSKGFAFVEMGTPEEARKVIKICQGVELDGQKLVVNEARDLPEKKNSRGSFKSNRK